MAQGNAPVPSAAGAHAATGSARPGRQAWLVGGGIASLAAAAYLVRDGHVAGPDIHILEQQALGGSLDAGGSAEHGYSMRGSRMFGPAYVLTYELLSHIPSLDDPAKSVTQDTLDFWQAAPWDARARLVENGRIVDATAFGLNDRDRVDLIEFMLRPEDALGARRIDACFQGHFFETHFWCLWSSMFGFETWHSAAELRRYLLRFLRLFPELASMKIIQSTRHNGHDSIVRPLLRWLEGQGVQFDTGVEVTDLDIGFDGELKTVQRLHARRETGPVAFDVGPRDLVIVTLGSMTADSSLGSMDMPAPATVGHGGGAWGLWRKLAARHAAFGRPEAFCGQVEKTTWITFTVTQPDDRFFRHMQAFSGSAAGHGGLVTLKGSPWGITFHLYHPPAYAGQPGSDCVWWGYGLFPNRVGGFVGKPMGDCSGREILTEVLSQLGLQAQIEALTAGATCIPCRLPYTTSQFMPRAPGDRPAVRPEGSVNLAFVGQYCEIPDNVVYTVEYSVHSALLAVASLLGAADLVPPAYRGLEHPAALVAALRRILA